MVDGFNIDEGIKKVVVNLIKNCGNFPSIIIDLLLGDKSAIPQLEYAMKSESYNNSLNEVVAVHRLFKNSLNESLQEGGLFNTKFSKNLRVLRRQSGKFQRKVLYRTLKEPGMLASLIYIIKAVLTPGYVLDDLIAAPQFVRFVGCLIKNAIDIKKEEKRIQTAMA